MGSVVVSDLVSTATRFPHTMLAGTASLNQLPGSEPVYRPSQGPSSDSRPSTRGGPSIDGPVPVERRPGRPTPSSSASHDAQRHAPMTTPIPVPRVRSNSQLFPNNSSSPAQPQAAQPHHLGGRLPDHHARATPTHDRPSSYLPSHAPRNRVPSPAPSAQTSLAGPSDSHAPGAPQCIKVRNISHLQQLASREHHRGHLGLRGYSPGSGDDVHVKYEISAMPVSDIIEMVAALLTKITTTNDQQHEHLHDHIPPPEGTAGLSPQASSVLAFHGKNVPTITILSYLTRIHRYCPTTYEVFLGLLVYFDRMTERVNSRPMQGLRQGGRLGNLNDSHETIMAGVDGRMAPSSASPRAKGKSTSGSYYPATPPLSASSSYEARDRPGMSMSPIVPEISFNVDPVALSQFFVVDSYNIHRLVIAGVTCASKFFSDVFYTNSRYAKVWICSRALYLEYIT